jgi:nucleoside-diphosphate-sugar epimerase
VVRSDIRNIGLSDIKSCDVIFHLAGISGYPACEANPDSAEKINVEATRKLVHLLSKDQALIYASTTAFYGSTGENCDESSEVKPASTYGLTKYAAERICQDRPNSVSLRFATIFGVSPRMRADLLVNDFVYKAVNERSLVIFDGKSRRTFLHIADAVNAYLFALDNLDRMQGQIYNVGDSALNYTKLEIAETIRRYIKYEIVYSSLPDIDARSFNIAFERLKSLGFVARHTLDDGIKDLLRLYGFYKPFLNYRPI